MIESLIPAYIKATKSNHSYEIKRSFDFDGHEVAWVETKYFLNSDTEMTTPCFGYRLMCDCDFIEGIGWNLNEKGHIYTVHGKDADACPKRKLAIEQRRLELRQQLEMAAGKDQGTNDKETVAFVLRAIEELVSIAKNHEMIEGGTGASFWGGYFYLQTVEEILGVEWKYIHAAMTTLSRAKKFYLDGMVIKTYTEPPAPEWQTLDKREIDEFILVRQFPTHERMPQTWKLLIQRKADSAVLADEQLTFSHSFDFGIDQEDLVVSDDKLFEMLGKAKDSTKK